MQPSIDLSRSGSAVIHSFIDVIPGAIIVGGLATLGLTLALPGAGVRSCTHLILAAGLSGPCLGITLAALNLAVGEVHAVDVWETVWKFGMVGLIAGTVGAGLLGVIGGFHRLWRWWRQPKS